MPVTKESTKPVTITTNRPVEISVTKQQSLAVTVTVTTTKEPVTMATSKVGGWKQTVPLAISHKQEMQQQKDGTDLEWGVDIGDIDTDLLSQLEELNSIIGQLGGIVCIYGV